MYNLLAVRSLFKTPLCHTLLLAMSFSLGGCTMWSQPKSSAWSNATGGEQFERLLWQAIKAKDWQAVDSRLASTFVAVGPEGAMDKQAFLAALKTMQLDDYSLGDFQVQPNGPDFSVTYTAEMRLSTPQGSREVHVRGLSVWQQQKKGWACIAESHSPAKPPLP